MHRGEAQAEPRSTRNTSFLEYLNVQNNTGLVRQAISALSHFDRVEKEEILFYPPVRKAQEPFDILDKQDI